MKRYLAGGMGSGEPERGIWGVENQSEVYGEWRTRARYMGSGELERGIWGVENQSEVYGEWRLVVQTVVKRDQ